MVYPLGTYGTTRQADTALAKVRVAIDDGAWVSPTESARAESARAAPVDDAPAVTVRDVAEMWLARIPSSQHRALSAARVQTYILPVLGEIAVTELTREQCDDWYDNLCPEYPTQRAACYAALRAILRVALDRDHIEAVPLRIKGAGRPTPKREPMTVSDSELTRLVAAMSPRYRAAILLAAWCGLRAGEVLGLQRADVVADPATPTPVAPTVRIMVRRHVVQNLGRRPGEPSMLVVRGSKAEQKTEAVVVPPHVVTDIWRHLGNHVEFAGDSWLFPALGDRTQPLHTSTLHRAWNRARKQTGLTQYIFHDLRRTGNTIAAESGATLAEMMQRLRHKSVTAAQAYIVAAHGADVALAERISQKAAPSPKTLLPTSPPAAGEDPVDAEVDRRVRARLRELGIESG